MESREEKGSETIERLLEAGTRLFADRGFDGTSVRALTSAAGVNLGAVTYHFESKEGLYRSVLESCFASILERITFIEELPVSAPQKLELFVRGMFQHLLENPDPPRFMFREIVLGGMPAPEILEVIRTVVGGLVRIIEEGQHQGSIRSGDPVLLALSTLSQPIYLSVMPGLLKRNDLRKAGLPIPQRSPENHAVSFLRHALVTGEDEE
jgi:AcrR family transcriptional regulator